MRLCGEELELVRQEEQAVQVALPNLTISLPSMKAAEDTAVVQGESTPKRKVYQKRDFGTPSVSTRTRTHE